MLAGIAITLISMDFCFRIFADPLVGFMPHPFFAEMMDATFWAMAAAISASGLMHGYTIADGAIISAYGPFPTWPFVLGYAGIAAVFFCLGSG